MSGGRSCMPEGWSDCGGGNSCRPGKLCTPTGCLPLDSKRVCDDRSYCDEKHECHKGNTGNKCFLPYRIGLAGGLNWVLGYNVQSNDPRVREAARSALEKEALLIGPDKNYYLDRIDLDKYDFVIGLAINTYFWADLGWRVAFDEFKNGEATREEQPLYNSLVGKSFDELTCHSNGAMICLAALKNGQVYAKKVVLYGPQITSESISLWKDLLNNGSIVSLDIYINEHDIVPPLSALLYALASSATVSPAYLAYTNIRGSLANQKILADALGKVDGITVHYLPCDSSPVETLHFKCHDFEMYKANRSKE